MKGEQQASRLLFLASVLRAWCADIGATWNVYRQLASISSCLSCLWFPSPLCFTSVHEIWSSLTSTGAPGWRHHELGGVGGAFWWTGKGLFYLWAATAANLGDDWVMKEGVRQELFLLALRGVAELDEKWDWAKAAIRCAENSQRSRCHHNWRHREPAVSVCGSVQISIKCHGCLISLSLASQPVLILSVLRTKRSSPGDIHSGSREEKPDPLGSNQVLSSVKDFDEEQCKRRIFVVVS